VFRRIRTTPYWKIPVGASKQLRRATSGKRKWKYDPAFRQPRAGDLCPHLLLKKSLGVNKLFIIQLAVQTI
jgi:hypothetical protein